jgi:hypothetical protein
LVLNFAVRLFIVACAIHGHLVLKQAHWSPSWPTAGQRPGFVARDFQIPVLTCRPWRVNPIRATFFVQNQRFGPFFRQTRRHRVHAQPTVAQSPRRSSLH